MATLACGHIQIVNHSACVIVYLCLLHKTHDVDMVTCYLYRETLVHVTKDDWFNVAMLLTADFSGNVSIIVIPMTLHQEVLQSVTHL